MKHLYPGCLLLLVCMLLSRSARASNREDSLRQRLRDPWVTAEDRIRTHVDLALWLQHNDPKMAFAELEAAIDGCSRLGKTLLEMDVLNQLGVLYYNSSMYDSSIAVFKRLLVLSASNEHYQSKALLNLAVNYMDMGRNNLAMDYLMKSLKLIRLLHKLNDEAAVLSNIGIIYTNKRDYEKALEYFSKALAINKQLKPSSDELCVAFLEMADIGNQMKNVSLAKKYNDSSDKYLPAAGDPYTLFMKNMVLADLEHLQKHHEQAEKYYRNALEYGLKIDFTAGLVDCSIKLGKCYMEQGKSDNALEYISNANLLSYGLKTFKLIAETEQLLGKLMLEKGFYKEARTHFDTYTLYQDSMLSNEMDNITQEMQARFEIQEATYQHNLLQKAKDDEIKVQRVYMAVIAVLAIVFLLFGVFEFFRYQKKQQLNNRLMMLNAEIMRQKEELEEKQAVLTELTREIDLKNKLLEKENKEKDTRIDEYAFYNAHELRSAVANILGLINVVKHNYHSEAEMLSILQMLDTASSNLDNIIKDFGKKLVHKQIEPYRATA